MKILEDSTSVKNSRDHLKPSDSSNMLNKEPTSRVSTQRQKQRQSFPNHPSKSSKEIKSSNLYNGRSIYFPPDKNPPMILHNIVQEFSFGTKAGMMTKHRWKTNQDETVINLNLLSLDHLHFFAVCDGHGSNGHIIAKFIKQNLPKKIVKHLGIEVTAGSKSQQEKLQRMAALAKEYPEKGVIPKVLKAAFLDVENGLWRIPEDVRYSGSTCASVLIFGRKMYVANLGDSRVLMVRKGNDHSKREAEDSGYKQLSKEHNLYDNEERQRVEISNGRIDYFRDKQGNAHGPPRVWLKEEDQPGLAMTRCFGDQVAKTIGVLSTPEIQLFKLHRDDRCIVLASDGIWEYLSNEEVASIVYPFMINNNCQGASEQLILRASERWNSQQSSIIDDITCIVVFLTNY